MGSQRRQISGVLLLDKPPGISSQAAVTRAKNLLRAVKAGHTGTLDPMASGLLPVCFGEATKFSRWLLNGDKTYVATMKLGLTTTTGDMEGAVTAKAEVRILRKDVETVLRRFCGEIMQTPPMYSAVKHAGQPLYKYARAGRELPRMPRRIWIFAMDVVSFEGDELMVTVKCGKGTYIRVLAEEIGRDLGCGGCLTVLRRTAVGEFDLSCAVTLEDLERMTPVQREAHLMPVDSLVASLPRIDLSPSEMRRIATGRVVEIAGVQSVGTARVYGPAQDFVGVAEVEASGRVVPQRLVSQCPVISL